MRLVDQGLLPRFLFGVVRPANQPEITIRPI